MVAGWLHGRFCLCLLVHSSTLNTCAAVYMFMWRIPFTLL